MLQLHVGSKTKIELPKGSFLYIVDEIPHHAKAKIFDPRTHSFNPLRGIEKRRARELARVLDTTAPEGENTLTVRNGRRALAKALTDGKRFNELKVRSRIKGVQEEVEEMIDELLFTDLMKQVLCSDNDFAFTGRNTKVFARINRADLGDDDALVLGLLLISHYPGQLVIPDLGFYGRDAHVSLIREERLIASVNFLGEFPDRLCQAVLSIKEKYASGATVDDAEILVRYAGYARNTNDYNDYIKEAIS